jgi:TRAP-type mannitol/chloroaromatic compound transport system permease small subunit
MEDSDFTADDGTVHVVEQSQTALGRGFDVFVRILNAIGTMWICLIMFLLNADVFMRYVFNAPIRGVPLVITLSVIVIVFLQLADALRERRVTRNDALIGSLLARRPRIGHALQAIYHLGGVVLLAILFWYSVPLLEKAWNLNSYSGARGDFTIPDWPLKLLILVGGASVCIQFARHFATDVRVVMRHSAETRPEAGSR